MPHAFSEIDASDALRLHALALQTATRLGLQAADADDVAQDTMLRLWELRDRQAHFGKVNALVRTIARNLSIDVFRRQSRTSLALMSDWAEADEPADVAASPEEQFIGAEQARELAALLAALPPTEHTLLRMRQVDGRSRTEMARLLGLTEASVVSLLSRARRHLLEALRKSQSQ